MRTFPLHPVLLVSLLALGACNGGEDFSDAIPGPVQSPDTSDFNPDNNCAARITGMFVHDGAVRNLAYQCGGFHGRTGLTGLEDERAQNFFVCPRSARSVEFYVGGKTRSLSLGTARFRAVAPAQIACSETKYDADGPYLFSIADLFEAPARVDVVGAASDSAEYRRSRNVAALLAGLDRSTAPDLVDIHDKAHELIYNPPDDYLDALPTQAALDAEYAEFVAADGVIQGYLDRIEVEGGQVGTLPAIMETVENALERAMNATAAGIYKLPPALEAYGLIRSGSAQLPGFPGFAACEECVPEEVVLGGALYRDIPQVLAAAEELDLLTVLALGPESGNLLEFLPTMFLDRHGRVRFGGVFEMVGLEPDQGDFVYHCDVGGDGRAPVFMTLEPGARLGSDLILDAFTMQGVAATAFGDRFEVAGRFINGQAYNGVASTHGVPDYQTHYPELPVTAHQFTEATDKTRFHSGALCGRPIDDQPVLALARAGAVAPILDADIMAHHFSQPQGYKLVYSRRADAEDEKLEARTELHITIHPDGAIYSDFDKDGNPGPVDEEGVPVGEILLGLVSSVTPGEDDATRLEDATLNIMLHNLGPAVLADDPDFGDIYGAYFRAQLVPGAAGEECTDRLFKVGTNPSTRTAAFWFSAHALAREYRAAAAPDYPAKYDLLRQYAYGVVGAERADCVPPPPEDDDEEDDDSGDPES